MKSKQKKKVFIVFDAILAGVLGGLRSKQKKVLQNFSAIVHLETTRGPKAALNWWNSEKIPLPNSHNTNGKNTAKQLFEDWPDMRHGCNNNFSNEENDRASLLAITGRVQKLVQRQRRLLSRRTVVNGLLRSEKAISRL